MLKSLRPPAACASFALLRAAWLAALLCCVSAPGRAAPVSAPDDGGQTVTLAAPARRIVSLAPHATELLFAAGAGAKIVGAVNFSDYPEAARSLPRVGDVHQLDLEGIAALKPDLIVTWLSGNPARQVERLRALGVPIFQSEPRSLEQIGDSLRQLGRLAGTESSANAAAQAYAADLAALRERYVNRPTLRVFYEVWPQPLMTVNGRHLISHVIALCGGVNVFGAQPALVPYVDAEAVLATQPQVIAIGMPTDQLAGSLAPWKNLPSFEPIARQAIVNVNPDWITRPTPRLLQGARQMCDGFERVRARLGAI